MSTRARVLLFLALLGLAIAVAAVWTEAARPERHFLRNLLRQLF